MKKKHRSVIIIGILCIITVCWLFTTVFSFHAGEVIIINNASERVTAGDIEICNQFFKLQDIKPGEHKRIIYKVKSDSDYKIRVEFESGKKFEKELGYVTNGLDFNASLILKDNDIELHSNASL